MKFKLLLPIVLLALSATSCVEVPEAKFTPYETMIISKTNQELPTAVASNLKGVNTVSVYPKIDAQLKETLVHNGERVKKGQVMFKLDDRTQYLALQSATAARLNAEANLSTAKLNYESNKELFLKNIVSSYVLEAAENNYKSAEAAVEVAKAEENVARTNLSYCDITAPVDGVLGEIVPSPGDLVSSTMFKPMTVISDNSKIIANFSLTENDYLAIQSEYGGALNLNMLPPVDLKLKDGSIYEHKGRITSVAGVVDKHTGSIVCEARFPNPNGKLLSGQNGTIIITYVYDDVIVIPMASVVQLQDKKLVYKVGADGCATATLITVAPENTGKDYIVTDGLTVGDEIVASGALTVQDGMKVK